MLLSLLCLFIAVVSCVDEMPSITIPVAPVHLLIDLNGNQSKLRNGLAFMIFTEEDRRLESDRFGYAGLLVVSDVRGETIYAYDLCCPHEKSRKIRVIPGDEGVATCPACGSQFITMYGLGTVESGPSTEALQRYRVIPLQSDRYRIIN